MKKLFLFIMIIFFLIVYSGCGLALSPSTKPKDKMALDFFDNKNQVHHYDVIIFGGEPEGVAAALSAARNGASTLLIEERDGLGGLFTYGKMNVLDFPHGIDNKILKSRVFKEWHHLVGNGKSFEIEKAKSAFLNLVYEQENLSMLLNTKIKEITVDQQEITAVQVLKNNQIYTLQADHYIDATQDADIAVRSGASSFVGAEDVGHAKRLMAATLMIHLQDVDWEKMKKVAKDETFGPAEVTAEAAWGFKKLRDMYKPKDENTRLRGLNLVRNDEGFYINALQIFGVDGLSDTSIQAGIARGKKETDYIVDWLRGNFPGFENAKVASYPTELYIRETRHIKSLYQLPVSDLWENKYHWDTIAFGGYPADIQATTPDDPGAVVLKPTQYGIPFRSIVPQNVTNLLVVGRSGGYSSLAQGSVRVVPTGMATGEGAGAASAIASKHTIDFHSMAKDKAVISQVQQALKAQGTAVEPFDIPFPYEDAPYYPAIRELLNHRALFGGYTNDLLEKETASNQAFCLILMHTYIAKRNSNPSYEDNIQYLNKYHFANELRDLTIEEMSLIMKELPYKDFDNRYMEKVQEWENGKTITRKDMYVVVGKIFGWL